MFLQATSPASLASSASLAGADADDAGDAGNVAQEVLRIERRTRGESNTPMFLRNCRKDLVERLGITEWYVEPGHLVVG